MSNFTSCFNNLKKIAKRFNFDCIENTHTHTCVAGFGIELRPIDFKTFSIIRGISSFNWLIVPSNSIFSIDLLSFICFKQSSKSSFSFKWSPWHHLLHWLDELGPYTSLGLTPAPMPNTQPQVGGPITSKNIWLSLTISPWDVVSDFLASIFSYNNIHTLLDIYIL